MDQAYNDTLKRLREQHQNSSDLAFRVLAWICCTGWKLPVGAIQHGLALREGDTSFHQDGIVDEQLLLSVCCGLVEIPEGSREIRLVHYTTEDFFRHNRHLLDEYFLVRHSLNFHLPSNADAYLARQCAACLSIGLPRHRPGGISNEPRLRSSYDMFEPDMRSVSSKKSEYIFLMKELYSNPLYAYSAFSWGGHVRRLSPSDQAYETSIEFLQTRGMVDRAVELVLTLGVQRESREVSQNIGTLHLAALFGLEDLAESLMKNYDINSRDSCGRTVLVWALECWAFGFKFKPKITTLVTQNFQIYDGIDIAYRRVVKALLRSGANPHVPGYNGDTPLHLAAISGDVDIVEKLLEYGVDIHKSNQNGNVPLVEAVRHGRELVYTKLLEHGTVDMCGENRRTALIEAASVGNLALIEKLIRGGARVDFPDATGKIALMEASKHGHTGIVKLLLKEQSEVDHQDDKLDTALMNACMSVHAKVIELLLVANCQLGIENAKGETALVNAGRHCGEGIVKRLLQHITNPVTRDQQSGTALVSAADWNRPVIVSLILEDAEFKPTSKDIGHALSVSCFHGYEKVVRLLIDHVTKLNMKFNSGRPASLLWDAIGRPDDAFFLMFLNADINVENDYYNGEAPIHAAAARGTKTMVQVLIEKRFCVNRRSAIGLLPLDYAMRREDKDTSIADLLRKHGAITEGKRLVQLMQDRSKRLN